MTKECPHLERAPIREALIDFRVRPGIGVEHTPLAELADSLANDYPLQDPIRQFHGQIAFDESGLGVRSEGGGVYGRRVASRDGLNVAQLRPDGFTFSRLAPYQSWKGMVSDAWPVWERFVAVVRPLGVGRVATRFINCLQVPPRAPLDRFLTAPPQIPPGLPTACSAFLFRYVTEATDGIATTVSLATETNKDPEAVSLVLDIDCYAHREFSVAGGAMVDIKETLTRLRERKNAVFFKSFTPETLEMWK